MLPVTKKNLHRNIIGFCTYRDICSILINLGTLSTIITPRIRDCLGPVGCTSSISHFCF
jgi:hypothetical protein